MRNAERYRNKCFTDFENGSKEQADYLLWLRNELFLALGIPEGDMDRRKKADDFVAFMLGMSPQKHAFDEFGLTDEVSEQLAESRGQTFSWKALTTF